MATSSLVYTLSNDGTYYIVGTGYDDINTLIADIEADTYGSTYTDGSGLDNTWTGGALEIPGTYNGLPVLGIATRAFNDIKNITTVTIGENIIAMGRGSFRSGTQVTENTMTSVTLPTTLTHLGGVSFQNRKGLLSVNLQATTITNIYSYTFNACIRLTSITIPSGVTSIGNGAFRGCSGLTSITIPSSVTSIGGDAFSSCSSLTSITIPSSVTSIGSGAFRSCSSLISITIENGVTSIGYNAFSNCSGLTSVTIPNSVTSIGSDAFWDCSSLTSITVESMTNKAVLGAGAFSRTNDCPIYVNILSYKIQTNWSQYANRIQRIPDTRYIDWVGAGTTSSTTTLTQSIPCEIGDKLLAVAAYRSALTIPQGWTLVATAPYVTQSGATQYMSIYSKVAESDTESLTITTGTGSARTCLALINVIDRTWREISSLNDSGTIAQGGTLTVTKSISNELLYLNSFITGVTYTPALGYTITGDYDVFQSVGSGGRLNFVYSNKAQNTDFTLTKVNSTSVYNTLGLELIVPSQQTNKVSWGSNNIAFSLGNNKNISISLGNILIYGGGSQPVVENAITTADGEILTDANGNYLQFGEGQPEEEYFLTFSSPNSFTLKSQQYNDNINFDTEEETETVTDNVKNWDGTIEYSTDKDTWTTWTGTSPISSASDGTNHNLYLRGTGNTYITGFEEYETDTDLGTNEYNFSFTGSNISCDGNMETLLDYATVELGSHPAMADYCCHNMFKGCTNLTSIPLLGTQTLALRCYANMFEGCAGLTSLPEDSLPANSLASLCYQDMFKDCTGLTTLPTNLLPATTTVRNCYNGMFKGCTGLTTVPSGLLPAMTLDTVCYSNMFANCTSLTSTPALPATTLADSCYSNMFYGCTSLTTSPLLPATTLVNMCYYNMFINCSNLIKIPKLSATTLAHSCYCGMFSGCSKIKLSTTQTGEYVNEYRIPDTGTGVVATDSLKDMFTSTGGTFTGTPTINTTYYTSNEVL